MITFTIIVFMIVALFMSMKKDKHNVLEDERAKAHLPSFTIHAKPMSTFSKVLNLATNKSQLLQCFSYSNGSCSIMMQNNMIFSAPLSQTFVEFGKVNGLITYKVQCGKQKVQFYQTSNISDKEWDAINGVLCLAGSTRGKSLFSTQAKVLGSLQFALKAIRQLS